MSYLPLKKHTPSTVTGQNEVRNGFIYAVRYCHMDQNAYRQRLVLQYFELRIALNKANGLKDDKTHLEFELRSDDDEDYVIIKSSGAHHGLRFSYRNKTTHNVWYKEENENFKDLFQYLVLGLQTIQECEVLDKQLTFWLFRLWMI